MDGSEFIGTFVIIVLIVIGSASTILGIIGIFWGETNGEKQK